MTLKGNDEFKNTAKGNRAPYLMTDGEMETANFKSAANLSCASFALPINFMPPRSKPTETLDSIGALSGGGICVRPTMTLGVDEELWVILKVMTVPISLSGWGRGVSDCVPSFWPDLGSSDTLTVPGDDSSACKGTTAALGP